MKIFYNSFLVPWGYIGISLFPIGIHLADTKNEIRKKRGLGGLHRLITHEKIHILQQRELSIVAALAAIGLLLFTSLGWYSLFILPLFYYLYIFNWLINLFIYGKDAYRNISFEREAKAKEKDLIYIHRRKMFSWIKYIIA